MIFCMVMILAISLMFIGQIKISDIIERHLHEDMPLTNQVLYLEKDFKEYTATLGLYLLSGNKSYLDKFIKEKNDINKIILQLNTTAELNNDLNITGEISEIHDIFKRIIDTSDQILTISSDPLKTTPGLAIANSTLGNLYSEMTTALKNVQESLLAETLDIRNLQFRYKIDSLLYDLARLSSATRGYLLFRNTPTKESVLTYLQVLKKDGEFLLKTPDIDIDQEDALNTLLEDLQAYRKGFSDLTAIHGSDRWRQDSFMVRSELGPLQADLTNQLRMLIEKVNTHAEKTVSGINDILNRLNLVTIIIGTIGTLVGLITMWIITNIIKRRIAEVDTAMESVAESGNLAQQLDESGADELSELSAHFNRFVRKIKALVDLVISASDALAKESNKMHSATDKSQQHIDQQQHDTEEITQTIEHVATSAERVKTNADAAAEAASSANANTQHGTRVLKSVIHSIQTLAGEVQEATKVIERVASESEQIGVVLSVIRTISEQTNLLALNAAIEAARAGEHGRGFAVVADEVRNLSQKIHLETDQIQTIINDLQESSREASKVMTLGSERSSTLVSEAESADNALSEIAASVATISSMNDNIATFSGEQMCHVNEVRSKVESIRSIASESSEIAQMASNSSNEFTIMAKQLQDLVEQFLDNKARNTVIEVSAEEPMTTNASEIKTKDNIELF